MAQRECDPVFRNRQGLPRESLGGEVGERIAAMAPFLREHQIKLIVAFYGPVPRVPGDSNAPIG